jgi:hypothetical protein
MKKISSLLLLSLPFFACQKELVDNNRGVSSTANVTNSLANPSNLNSAGYMNVKIGSELSSFNSDGTASVSELGAGKSLKLVASLTTDANTSETIQLYINFLSGSPAAGTYTQGDRSFSYVLNGVYKTAEAKAYSAGMTPSAEQPLSITITSITDTEIKGTFKGAFYKHNLSTGEISSSDFISITDGAFTLPVK